MITANEAVALVNQSDAKFKELIDNIDKQIREAATKGQRFIYPHSHYDHILDVADNGMLTPLQEKLKDELYKHGFIFTTDTYVSVSRSGIGCFDDNESPKKQTSFIIRW